jgi:hypothetical protein
MLSGQIDDRFQLPLVFLEIITDPGAECHVESVFLGQGRDVLQDAVHRVGSDRVGPAGQKLQITIDFSNGGGLLFDWIVPDAQWREGKTLDSIRPGRLDFRTVEQRPATQGDESDGHANNGVDSGHGKRCYRSRASKSLSSGRLVDCYQDVVNA